MKVFVRWEGVMEVPAEGLDEAREFVADALEKTIPSRDGTLEVGIGPGVPTRWKKRFERFQAEKETGS